MTKNNWLKVRTMLIYTAQSRFNEKVFKSTNKKKSL